MRKETKKPSVSKERQRKALRKIKERMLFEKLANSNFTEEVTCFVSYDKE